MFNLASIYSACKSSNHKLFINHKIRSFQSFDTLFIPLSTGDLNFCVCRIPARGKMLMLMMMLITVMVIVISMKLTVFLIVTFTVSDIMLLQVWFQNHRRREKKKAAPTAGVQAPTAASTAVASKHTLDHQESYRPVQAPTASSTAVAPKHTLDHQESYHHPGQQTDYRPQAPQHVPNNQDGYNHPNHYNGYHPQSPNQVLNNQWSYNTEELQDILNYLELLVS